MALSTLGVLAVPLSAASVAVITQTPITSPAAPTDLTGLAAMITAGIGAFAFIISIWRGKQNNQTVQGIKDAASYVHGFEAVIKRLEEEIDELREQQGRAAEEWEREREQLKATITTLQRELDRQTASNFTLRGELAELRGQIKGFLNAQEYEEFQRHFR